MTLTQTEKTEETVVTINASAGIHAYVDGSFNKTRQVSGWGYVLLDNDVVIEQASGIVIDPDLVVFANVAGELTAAMRVALWSHQNQTPVAIHYDYNGIEKWITGEWQARSTVAKQYVEFMQTVSSLLSFVKVKAHSGNKLNDYADQLAYNATIQE